MAVAAVVVGVLGAGVATATLPVPPPAPAPAVAAEPPPPDAPYAPGPAAGDVPDDLTVTDDGLPAVDNLDPGLLAALRLAAPDAAARGITLYVTSGWRSPQLQQHMYDDAVARYGPQYAAQRVATADTSLHVAGDAVDIGRTDAAYWLADHGDAYGLCQVYLNEPWHYELRPDAVAGGCPSPYADPSADPRMR
ncbi:hypothetical protein AFB00_01915 [Pseudonocardia sp. HH130630-07]|nr:hypothetical protein AFB00_01915 [Pseudonocardia sp. HH130630-07]